MGFDVNRAFQPVQHALHDVHAYAASRNFRYFARGAEPGAENEVQRFRFIEARRILAGHQSQLDGRRLDTLYIHASPVIADFHDHLVALVIGAQPQDSLGRLAGLLAFVRRLQAVADRVTNQMG